MIFQHTDCHFSYLLFQQDQLHKFVGRLFSSSVTRKDNNKLKNMASQCLGNFGAYRQAYSRHKDEVGKIEDGKDYGNTVWVIKRYVPTDLRLTAPVPRYKLMAPSVDTLAKPESHWIRPREPIPQAFQQGPQERNAFISQPSTRCEEWSTLTQMLPSRGQPDRAKPPNWGTGYAQPPPMTPDITRRFPHINSPMTRCSMFTLKVFHKELT